MASDLDRGLNTSNIVGCLRGDWAEDLGAADTKISSLDSRLSAPDFGGGTYVGAWTVWYGVNWTIPQGPVTRVEI